LGTELIEGVICTQLRIIDHPMGPVLHGMKARDRGFAGFGEAYFSTVLPGAIKGWKKHKKMTLNFVVPSGSIRVVVYDDRVDSPTYKTFGEWKLSADNYCRLTIPPHVWVGFQGLGQNLNLLLNIASIEHDPSEAENRDLNFINYQWQPS
jgi:dTDP-4-dehydrorhamnose 3,5-epimerase